MLFFLFGPDTYRSQQKLNELEKKFIQEKDKSALNVVKLANPKLSVAEWQKEVMSGPFLAEKKMIITKNFLSNLKEEEESALLEFLQTKKWRLDNIVIFWEETDGAGYAKTNEPEILTTAIALKTTVNLEKKITTRELAGVEIYWQEFNCLTEAALLAWINSEVKTRSGKINSQAAKLLALTVGSDLWRLSHELDKLVALKLTEEITTAEVQQLTVALVNENIFKLTEAIGQKNKTAAHKLLQEQLTADESETSILSRITWYFRVLIQVKDMVEKNGGNFVSYDKLAKELGEKSFTIQKSYGQLKNFSLVRLKEIYQELVATEVKLKSSQAAGPVLLGLLIEKLTS